MLDWLPDFLDGLFHMLSDSNREIRQAAGSAIGGFLNEIKRCKLVELCPMVGILVDQCRHKERSNRLTAMIWVRDFIKLGGHKLLLCPMLQAARSHLSRSRLWLPTKFSYSLPN